MELSPSPKDVITEKLKDAISKKDLKLVQRMVTKMEALITSKRDLFKLFREVLVGNAIAKCNDEISIFLVMKMDLLFNNVNESLEKELKYKQDHFLLI